MYIRPDGSFSQYKANGPNKYQANRNIKFTVHVSDDAGEVTSGCYAMVAVLQNGSVIGKDELACYPGYGWVNEPPGTYTLRFEVTTDWGAKAQKAIEIEMV